MRALAGTVYGREEGSSHQCAFTILAAVFESMIRVDSASTTIWSMIAANLQKVQCLQVWVAAAAAVVKAAALL